MKQQVVISRNKVFPGEGNTLGGNGGDALMLWRVAVSTRNLPEETEETVSYYVAAANAAQAALLAEDWQDHFNELENLEAYSFASEAILVAYFILTPGLLTADQIKHFYNIGVRQ